ncbi:MAG: long-chain fatty acid--CoA ligase [Syntrophobacterales bacterium]|nr:MAG: long-chain fatty acid--CoA ligase [Syntrophobacterales bacterium]
MMEIRMEQNLGKMLEHTCRTYPKRVSLIYRDTVVSYSELDRAVNAFGNRLKALGVTQGDKVAIMLPNIPEFIVSYFAILKLGAVAVTINIQSTPYELLYLLDNCDAKACIIVPSSAKRFKEIRKQLQRLEHLITTDERPGNLSIHGSLEEGAVELEMPEIKGEDPAVMIYTSGLTGKPLGAVLTHRNLSTQSVLLEGVLNGTPDDRGLCLIPLFHSFGAVANMLMVLEAGANLVMIDQFNLDALFMSIEENKITYVAAVPRVFLGMILFEGAEKYDISSLRFCITGGSAMPPEYIPMFEKKFGVMRVQGYGLTETSPACSVNRIDGVRKPGSIGPPLPGIEVQVLDDAGSRLDAGKVGELIIRGPNVMQGYYNDEAATAEVIRDGWIHTGDLARIDEEGYIFIEGLKKRMIITSGFNVYPKEVENVLRMHPAVSDAQVTGQDDLMRGEIVKALIIKKEGSSVNEKDIMKHCRKYLSSYKSPREVEFVERLD